MLNRSDYRIGIKNINILLTKKIFLLGFGIFSIFSHTIIKHMYRKNHKCYGHCGTSVLDDVSINLSIRAFELNVTSVVFNHIYIGILF